MTTPVTPAAITSSQGVTFSFAGTIGHITSIDVSRSAGTIDTSDLALADGDPRSYEPAQLLDGDEVKIEALFSEIETYPEIGDSGLLSTSLGTLSGTAVCTASSVKYAVGEVVKVSMSFKLGGTPD
jgi:hypothetical protein